MQSVRFIGVGRPAQIQDVAKPSPGPGQVLIKIGGAGVCHSDLHVMEEDLGFKPPFTLGHENAGWIAELGQGVTGFKEGDAVAVYGPWGCGRCHACQVSMENYCENWAQVDGFGGGLGLDGGMAEYMLVPSPRLLVPLGDLSPAKAAPLSDAALTPYHAIKRALSHLTADSTVVVAGVGGLGHMAIQLLRVLAPVRIVAADVDDRKLEHAKALGADDIVNNRNASEAAERIRNHRPARGRSRARLRWRAGNGGFGRQTARSKQRLDDRGFGWRSSRLPSREHPVRRVDEHSVLGHSRRIDGSDCDGARRQDSRRDGRVSPGRCRRSV